MLFNGIIAISNNHFPIAYFGILAKISNLRLLISKYCLARAWYRARAKQYLAQNKQYLGACNLSTVCTCICLGASKGTCKLPSRRPIRQPTDYVGGGTARRRRGRRCAGRGGGGGGAGAWCRGQGGPEEGGGGLVMGLAVGGWRGGARGTRSTRARARAIARERVAAPPAPRVREGGARTGEGDT